jgi:hypothetical protein
VASPASNGADPIRFEEIGSWWSGGAQIDVVGINRAERRVLFGEAKWTRESLAESVLCALIERSNRWLGGRHQLGRILRSFRPRVRPGLR